MSDAVEKRPCPCCGYHTLPSRNDYEVCPVCFWEDEPGSLEEPDGVGGSNAVSLREGRRNFERYGAMEARFRSNVRSPKTSELPRVFASLEVRE